MYYQKKHIIVSLMIIYGFQYFLVHHQAKFTRVQRCTCCFVLLFFSMFLNIMYYDLQNEVARE